LLTGAQHTKNNHNCSAKVSTRDCLKRLDSGFRRNDRLRLVAPTARRENGIFLIFYETIGRPSGLID